MTPAEFLGAAPGGDGRAFAFGRHLHGAFGGVFGGALAAATVVVARECAPGRTPASLDCRFLRALPAGRARAAATTLHEGRSMTTVVVDLVDERERTTTHATITLVDPSALAPLSMESEPAPSPLDATDGEPWRNPPGVDAPIIETLKPRALALAAAPDRSGTRSGPEMGTLRVPERVVGPIATAIDLPWDGDATAEAVCLAADLCVGPPVAAACRGRRLAHPNPDLSLRFAHATIAAATPIVAAGRLAALDAGLATVAIEVAAGGRTVGVGASFSVLLEPA